MNQSLEQLMMDEANSDEMQAKKLMTVAKSKYYMLKVNYPTLAESIDNTPATPDVPETTETTETLRQESPLQMKSLAE